jgi:thiamine kinase-like enzyme
MKAAVLMWRSLALFNDQHATQASNVRKEVTQNKFVQRSVSKNNGVMVWRLGGKCGWSVMRQCQSQRKRWQQGEGERTRRTSTTRTS